MESKLQMGNCCTAYIYLKSLSSLEQKQLLMETVCPSCKIRGMWHSPDSPIAHFRDTKVCGVAGKLATKSTLLATCLPVQGALVS